MEIGMVMAGWSIFSMLLVIVLMFFDGKFLPSQMGKIGLAGIANGAIPANLVLISMVLYIVGPYTEFWSKANIVDALIGGMLVSWYLYFRVYQRGKYDDGLAHPLSLAGVVFFIYGGAMYAAIALFYLHSSADWSDILKIGVLLLLYVPTANHAVLNLFDDLRTSLRCPDFFREESSPKQFIIWGEVFMVTLTAAKLRFPNPWW